MKNRLETRRSLQWILAQDRTFFGAQMADALGMMHTSACRQLRRLDAEMLIEHVAVIGRCTYYKVRDRERCELLAKQTPKPANGYTPVKQRPAPRLITSVWSLAA